MSEVFKGTVRVESDPFSEHARFPLFDDRGVVLAAWNERYAEHVTHAINQHDALTQLNKEMVRALGLVLDTTETEEATKYMIEMTLRKAKELNK